MLMNVGVIGLGQMGRGMARSLLRTGFTVKVWNRTRSRAEELTAEGAQVAETPAEACTGDAVITCLADDAAIEAVMFEEAGIAAALIPSCVHISTSTLSVDMVRQLTQVHEARN